MFMIKSDDQRQKTLKTIRDVEARIQKFRAIHGPRESENYSTVMRRFTAQLEEQVRTYDELMAKGLKPFHPKQLSQVGSYLVKARVVSKMTQSALAKKLAVSQPMVYKYENSEYEGAGLELLSRVAESLGVSIQMELFHRPKPANRIKKLSLRKKSGASWLK